MSIDSILRQQGGVISRHQATAAGLTPGAVDDQLRRRRWRPLLPQVYLAAGRPADPEVRMRAALLWVGEGAVLSGAAAAWWTGLLRHPPETITVAVPRRPPRPRPGIVVRRRELVAADLAEQRGIRLTARPLTVLEAAIELGAAGGALLDRELQGRLPLPALDAAYRRNPSAGSRLLLGTAADRSEAAARRLLVRLLRDSGAPGWRAGGPGAAVTFPSARVVVAVTGWAQPVAEPLAGPGWTVRCFAWSDLVSRPRWVQAQIAAAVRGDRRFGAFPAGSGPFVHPNGDHDRV